MGSLSTYTTWASGMIFWTTSWVLPTVGSPDPMSMNCRTPCWPIHLAARWWKPRLDQAASLISGAALRICSAAKRSTWK